MNTAVANKKKLYIEEWGVMTSYTDDFDKQVAAINAQGVPWVRRLILLRLKIVVLGELLADVAFPYRPTGRLHPVQMVCKIRLANAGPVAAQAMMASKSLLIAPKVIRRAPCKQPQLLQRSKIGRARST